MTPRGPAGYAEKRRYRMGLAERRAKMDSSERPWQPRDRQRQVTLALRAYAKLTTSAATGAVRDPGL